MHFPTTHRSGLPWLAALAAALTQVLLFLVNVGILLNRPEPMLSGTLLASMLLSGVAGLFAKPWLAFLIAQWQGEACGPLAVRRPVPLLLIFAAILLAWMLAVALLYSLLMVQMTTSGSTRMATTTLGLLAMPLDAAGIWLAWWLATRLRRNDAMPARPQPAMTLRADGLIAAGLAVLLAQGAPSAISAAYVLLGGYGLGLLAYVGAALPMLGLAFGGTMLGLGRHLAKVHGGRVVLVTLLAPLTIALWTYGLWRLLAGSLIPALHLPASAAAWTMLVLLYLGVIGSYGLWARACYTRAPRVAVSPPPL